ncbi:MAG: hypothetical protein P0S95_04100 [Rhabdochlamydiaceae bacterium]|nr:hypothetical protein [Candidatus Amphrikana amoebophyrae]
MNLFYKSFSIVILVFVTVGCGYHLSSSNEPISVSIPFIIGDRNGTLTSAIIEEVSKCNNIEYGGSSAPYTLDLEFVSRNDEQIGYRYRTEDNNSALIKNLAATESRQVVRVKVSLISKASHQPLIKPIVVEATIDYDYVDSQSFNDLAFIDSAGATTTVLNRSLGQLDAPEDAKSISNNQLYHSLARKIAAALNFAVDIPYKPVDQKKISR